MNKIDGEQTYPIYSTIIKWTEDIPPDSRKQADWQVKDLPEGRRHDSTQLRRMYKEDQDIETLKNEIETGYVPKVFDMRKPEKVDKSHSPIINPELKEVSVKFERYETWCLEWFCHWTFDDGKTDEEYLASFERFVRRMEQLPEGEYCLMGAEDRWRWSGTTDDGKDKTQPPCRCAGCQNQNKVRINH